jgi:hypothetical protein
MENLSAIRPFPLLVVSSTLSMFQTAAGTYNKPLSSYDFSGFTELQMKFIYLGTSINLAPFFLGQIDFQQLPSPLSVEESAWHQELAMAIPPRNYCRLVQFIQQILIFIIFLLFNFNYLQI